MNFLADKKIYLVIILWLVFLGILIKFILLPFLVQLKDFSQKLIQEKKIQNSLEYRIKNFEEFSKNYSYYQKVFNKIKNFFVVELEVPIEFIKFLEKETERAQLKLEISPLAIRTEKGDLWPSIGFRVIIAGKFPNCLNFLERLEHGPWLIEIFQLRIERISKKFTPPQREFGELKPGDVYSTLNLKVFSLKQ